MAALKAAATVLVLAIIAMIIFSALIQPQQTLGCLALFLCVGLIARYPVPGLLFIGGLALVGRHGKK